MLIRVCFILLTLLSTLAHINGKKGRRKGMLTQTPDFEWKGRWFPFDPSAPLTTTTTTTTTTTVKPPTSTSTSNVETWTGPWFPFDPSLGIDPHTSPEGGAITKPNNEEICDDFQHSIGIDFDPSDKRHSYNYLCLSKNRTRYKPNLDIEAIRIEYFISPAYVPPIKCLNESIEYNNPLPTFGSYRPSAPKYGTYRYLPPQRWLHSIAEGAIVMLYHPCAFPGQVKLLQDTVRSCMFRHIITSSQNLSPERPLALISWGKLLQMSVVDDKIVVDFIKSNAKLGPLPMRSQSSDSNNKTYEIDILKEAKLITDIEDTEICGYKEM